MSDVDITRQELDALGSEQQISDAAWEDIRADFTVAAIEVAATLGDPELLERIETDPSPSGWVRPEYFHSIADRSPEAAASVLQRMHELGQERRTRELGEVSLFKSIVHTVTGKGPRLGL